MKLLIIFVAFSAIVNAENFIYEKIDLKVPENVEDFIKLKNSRIQNGNNVNSNTEWPFVVKLTITMAGSMFTCSGSIINNNFLLSARNCVIDPTTGIRAITIMSYAGSHNAENERFASFGEQGFFVSTPNPPEPNFATIRMREDFPLSASIQIIRLPSSTQAGLFFEMTSAFIAGWGSDLDQGSSQILQTASGIITSRAECSTSFVPSVSIYDICFRGGSPPTTLDRGDMGGPLIIREFDGNTLIGVLDRTVSTVQPGIQMNLVFRIGMFWNFIHDTANVTRRW